jgi:wobble nucleotide-excising tRNase
MSGFGKRSSGGGKNMIKKIKSIQSLAVFHDFNWDNHVKLPNGSADEFKHINILYGRNYSGKTTLSRIIRALETGEISSNYISPHFSVLWKDGNESSVGNLQNHKKTIRVFNEDFVRDNLRFLIDSTNSEGQISPFAIIGGDNVKIEKEIKELNDKLGNNEVGKETELYEKIKNSKIKLNEAEIKYKKASDDLQKKKSDKATGNPNGIKYRSNIFGDQNYNINKIDADIETVLSPSYTSIDDKKRQELEHSLNDMPKPSISPLPTIILEFQSFSDKVKEIVERKVGDSEKIQELLLEYALNKWVKEGCEFHKNKRKNCAFCGGEISSDRWDVLEKHFDEETGNMEKEIEQLIEQIDKHKEKVEKGFNEITKELFYSNFHTAIDKLITEYKDTSSSYIKELNSLVQQLEKRKKTITKEFDFVVQKNYTSKIEEIITKYNDIRVQSNEHTNILSDTKKETQKILKLHEIRTFVDTIDYTSEKEKINELEQEKQNIEKETQVIQSEIDNIIQMIEDRKSQLNDEEKGAKRVNDYLTHFFGHQSLKLKPITDEETEDKKIHFEIYRGDQRAFNLSEGECSLIAFCYFMAKLDDVSTNGKQAVIWIDDPVSSLDGNHIFFVYSLLRAEIVDKKRFEQLFVSTHNLDFLKYLKRLTGKNETGQDYQNTWLMIERTNDNALIKDMPKYLKEYITEFNYLFQQIYKCAKATVPNDDNYTTFYNFGNNLRKFLDIYLYYKFPDGVSEKKSRDNKVFNLFGEKITSFLTDRISNEYSHFSGTFERGSMPIDIPEMQSVAQITINTIRNKDKEQYESLLKSIGEEDIALDTEMIISNIPENKPEEIAKDLKKDYQKTRKKTKTNSDTGGYLFDDV